MNPAVRAPRRRIEVVAKLILKLIGHADEGLARPPGTDSYAEPPTGLAASPPIPQHPRLTVLIRRVDPALLAHPQRDDRPRHSSSAHAARRSNRSRPTREPHSIPKHDRSAAAALRVLLDAR
jgi:hypothetical protein